MVEPEWEVETIIRVRGTPGRRRFLVKWANSTQRQFLPQESLTRCPQLLKEYYERKNLPIPLDIQELIDGATDSESDSESESESEDESEEMSQDEESSESEKEAESEDNE